MKGKLIECACGCGELRPQFDKRGRPRIYKDHHHKPAWRGGRYISNGYVQVYMPNHPYCNCNDYILEHRLVMEKHLGRYLTDNEHIHHKNGNRQDNRIENLQLVTNSEHMSITMIGKPKTSEHRQKLSEATKKYMHSIRNE